MEQRYPDQKKKIKLNSVDTIAESAHILSAIDLISDKVKQGFGAFRKILNTESTETKHMLTTIHRLLRNDPTVTDQEKRDATEQFFDLIKLAGLGTFVALTLKIPFSTEGMLILARAMKKYLGINILPSSIKERSG